MKNNFQAKIRKKILKHVKKNYPESNMSLNQIII